jgi:succinoglycan biosynthesis protein ExoL
VSTSPGFVEKYYQDRLGMRDLPSLVIENKVDPDVTPKPLARAREARGPIRIGWFGMLRCERSWQLLRRVAREGDGRFQVVLRGVPTDRLADIPERVRDEPHIRYEGSYSVPDDLPEMYGDVDLCWMVHHDTQRPYESWRWARSNRLYQAGWYGTPMVGQVGKDDSTVLAEHGLGMTLDVADLERSAEAFRAIDREDVLRWRRRFAAVPESQFALSHEHESLLSLLGKPAEAFRAPADLAFEPA